MLDVKLLREDPKRAKEGVKNKNVDPKLVDAFLELDTKWRELTTALDTLRNEQNKASEKFKELGDKEKEELKGKKGKIKKLEEEIREIEKEREVVLMQIPNLPSEDTPIGKDETANKVVRTWGKPPRFDFEPKDHMAIGEALDLINVERAAEISGTRFGYIKREAALLEFALLQFAFHTLTNKEVLRELADRVEKGYSAEPFVPVVPPVLIRSDVYRRTGRLTPNDEEEKYYIPSDDLYLVGSAEHTLAPLHMDEVIDEKKLPLRYVGFSTSFRREAGSYGKDTRGILRVHQFDKLEMESFTTPEQALKEQEFFVRIEEYLMQSLELPHQVVLVSTGDMGGPDYRQFDIETWLPGQNHYRETHTADLVGDYQARSLSTWIKRTNGEKVLAHMNDGTVFAIGRILIAILENYQTKDGKVKIPTILQPYVGKKIIG